MKKILLIEDNEILRENTAEILTLANYHVETAENGKIGVERARFMKPDLIICDIMMPELDGYGVLNILGKSEETANIPFIFLSAKSDRSDFRKGMSMGADDYITKPFGEIELIEAIELRLKRAEKNVSQNNNNSDDPVFIDEAKGMEILKALSNDRKVKSYGKKEEIYRQNDYANYLYFVLKGKVKSIQSDAYGKIILNSIHGPGSFIGYTTLLDNGDYHETAIAMTDTEVAIIPKSDYVDLVKKNRSVAVNLINQLSASVRERESRLLQLAYAPVRERVAKALLMLKERANGDGRKDEIRISRDDLASVVGTAKESLIRMLSEIKKDGLIESDGLTIRIIDEAGLRRISCD